MTDKTARGFLEHIIAHPDDDAPRLVYADWLEENGQPERAEFIRVQLERASLPSWDARQVPLRLRERELFEEHGGNWKGELPDIKGVSWGVGFRRGFVATATFAGFGVFATKAAACWAAAPVEAVTVRWPRRGEYSNAVAPVAGLRELTVTGRVVDRDNVGRLANAKLLSTLRVLNVSGVSLGAEGFRELVRSPYLGRLAALNVSFNSIGNGGLPALFDAPALTSLAGLDLSETGSYGRYGEDPIIDAAGLALLARWPGLARLRALTVSGNNVGRGGLHALLQSPYVVGLKRLAVRDNAIDGGDMEVFGAAHPGLQLDELDLGENMLQDLGVEYLARAACLHELKALNLDRCEIRATAAGQLAKAPFFPGLRVLDVNQNNLGPQGVAALLGAKPPQLHTLRMMNNDLGDKGAARLAASPGSDSLLWLDLGQNILDDEAARELAGSRHLRNLLALQLDDNPIGKAAGAELRESSLGKRLAFLKLPQGFDAAPGGEVPLGDDDIPF